MTYVHILNILPLGPSKILMTLLIPGNPSHLSVQGCLARASFPLLLCDLSTPWL